MKNLILSSMIVACGVSLAACNSGGSDGGSAQNMPVGGTPFSGTFTPGIGNVTSSGTSCNFTASTENLIFTVSESTPTNFIDITNFANQTIFTGNFINPVNQNSTCFNGTVTYSQCGNAQSGTIKFVGCSVYLSGSQYIFRSQYYLYSAIGNLLTTGSVYATK
ncbi:MAG: hypothetical protein KA049_00440 [Burkholderiales bacterium]|nr:hypothetical protein [Burkholderiales bacterium]MBP9767954.1 hypothetical protein [Burkholderiales bacterium]